MTPGRKTKLTRWLFGCGAGILLTLLLAGWYINSAFHALGDMSNQVYQEVKSPDGRTVATLAYRSGMTFGYGFLCLQPSQNWHPLKPEDPIPPGEVVEVAAEGLDTISWQGNDKLVVTYTNSGNEAAQFVLKPKQWRNVAIVYRGTP